jgi:hypothetical protein
MQPFNPFDDKNTEQQENKKNSFFDFLSKLPVPTDPFDPLPPSMDTLLNPTPPKSQSNFSLNNLDDKQIDELLKSIQLNNQNTLTQPTTPNLNKQPSQLNKPITQQSNQPQPISQKSYINPEDLTDKELEEAQERSRQNELFALLSRAINQFGAGLSGAIASGSGFGAIVPSTKASDEFSDQLLKLANRPVEDVLLKRKQEQEKIKTLTDKQKLELQQRLSDPSSDISKMARQLYEKAMGKKLPDNISAMDIQLAGFDTIVKALVDQETNKIRLEELKQDKIMKSDMKMAERLDKVTKEQKETEKLYDETYALIDEALKNPTAVRTLQRRLVLVGEGHAARISNEDVKEIFGVSNVKDLDYKIKEKISGTLNEKKADEIRNMIDKLKKRNDQYYNQLKEDMIQKYINIQSKNKRSEDEIRETLMMQKKKEEQVNQLDMSSINRKVEEMLPFFKQQQPDLSEEQIRAVLTRRFIKKNNESENKKEGQVNQLNTPIIDNMVEKLLPKFKEQNPNIPENQIREEIKRRLINFYQKRK